MRLIAIDTTGSMTRSIENARRDARTIVAKTQHTRPNERFAVVHVRDDGDTGGSAGSIRPGARFTMGDGGSFTARRRATLGIR